MLIRHGELVLKPIKKSKNKVWKKKTNYIASHSETGHHHIVAGISHIFAQHKKNVIMRIGKDTTIKHKKSFDKHKTLLLPAGDYELIKKTEYDPFKEIIRRVID